MCLSEFCIEHYKCDESQEFIGNVLTSAVLPHLCCIQASNQSQHCVCWCLNDKYIMQHILMVVQKGPTAV